MRGSGIGFAISILLTSPIVSDTSNGIALRGRMASTSLPGGHLAAGRAERSCESAGRQKRPGEQRCVIGRADQPDKHPDKNPDKNSDKKLR
jgi:hypothetical protein